MSELKKQIRAWGLSTVDGYRKMAAQAVGQKHEIYTAFYTQSNLNLLTHSPFLAILAINPNTICSYDDQVSNSYWGTTREKGMTAEIFLKGNPDFENRDKWQLWKNLYTIFQYGHINHLLDKPEDYVYTNIVNFNSRHPYQIPKSIFTQCAAYTFDLLQILQPKVIICLGKDPFDYIVKSQQKEAEELIPGVIERTYLEGSTVIKIPHTATRYTREAKQLVGSCLELLIARPDCSGEELRDSLQSQIQAYEDRKIQKKEIKQSVYSIEVLCSSLPYPVLDKVRHRYRLSSLLELIINEKEGCVGIRHLVRHGNYLLHTEPYEEEFRLLLKNYGYDVEKTQSNCAWLGRKNFPSYGSSVDISHRVVEELFAILKETEDL